MNKKSRDFEKLVARVERSLLNTNAIVKSPDHLPDKDTGQLREVDASITIDVGSSHIVITIEDRDRKSKQAEDVRWIEELTQKKNSLGVNHTIAVSSTGFTRPAKAKAKASGIDLRKISELTQEDFKKWLSITEIGTISETWDIKGIDLETFELDQDETIDDRHLQALKTDRFDSPVVVDAKGKSYSADLLLRMWEAKSGSSFIPVQDMTVDEVYRYRIEQAIGRGVFWIPTNKGKREVSKFIIYLSAVVRKKSNKFTRYLRYEKDTETIAEVAQANVHGKYNFEIHRNTKNGQVKFNVYEQE